jgi:molybdopterin converting factor small subunit
MQITLEYVAQIKKAAGKASETLTVDKEAALGQVLKSAAQRLGREFAELLFDEAGAFRASLLITVNDEQVDANPALPLNDRDRITLLSPMSGG